MNYYNSAKNWMTIERPFISKEGLVVNANLGIMAYLRVKIWWASKPAPSVILGWQRQAYISEPKLIFPTVARNTKWKHWQHIVGHSKKKPPSSFSASQSLHFPVQTSLVRTTKCKAWLSKFLKETVLIGSTVGTAETLSNNHLWCKSVPKSPKI